MTNLAATATAVGLFQGHGSVMTNTPIGPAILTTAGKLNFAPLLVYIFLPGSFVLNSSLGESAKCILLSDGIFFSVLYFSLFLLPAEAVKCRYGRAQLLEKW